MDESKPKCVTDPPNWVSVRLREAGNIMAGAGHTCAARHVDRLLFALADRAEFMERNDIYPLRESNWGMVFANAVILAAGVVEEFESGVEQGNDGSDEGDPEAVRGALGVPGVGDPQV